MDSAATKSGPPDISATTFALSVTSTGAEVGTIASKKPQIQRTNSTLRAKPGERTPKTPLRPQPDRASDENSLTSFPSLSPSLENSPENPKGDILSKQTNNGEDPVSPTKLAPPSLQDLFQPDDEDADRSTLFFDAPRELRDVPGTLHLQTDDNIAHLLRKTGAVKLVKQLSLDLAQRDAHVTLVQRKAEERERLLRKMLRDCEVSNLDIENKLRDIERSRIPRSRGASSVRSGQKSVEELGGTGSDAGIDERLEEALEDEIIAESGTTLYPDLGQARLDRTIRPVKNASSQQKTLLSSGTARGWKSLFRGGNETNRRVTAQQNVVDRETVESDARYSSKGAHANAFSRSVSRASSTAGIDRTRASSVAESDSSATSNSLAAWAIHMVGGNAHNGTSRAQLPSIGDSDIRHHKPARTGIGNINSGTMRRNPPTSLRSPRESMVTTHGLNGTLRRMPSEASHNSLGGLVSGHSPQPSTDGSETNLGPVEMDTILPEDTRPPTLGQTTNSAEFLTDNFGFIYDQRRRRKVNDATHTMPRNKRGSQIESLKNLRRTSNYPNASSTSHPSDKQSLRPNAPLDTEDVPIKRWQDFLKFTGAKSELLSHTPSPGPITDIATSEPEASRITLVMSKRGSAPTQSKTPEPSTTRVVSENAEIVSSTSQPASPGLAPESDSDPVKALVEHLSEVHETAQREKTHKWNDFLRKVRADRCRDSTTKDSHDARTKGSQMPEAMLTDGEIIGVAGLGIRGKVGRAKANEFRQLVLAGVPTAYRSKIWAEGSGAVSLRVPGYYEELTTKPFEDDTIVQQIQMDITRTLTDNIYYRRGAGVDKLKEVLLAYARRNPEIGYCQGMNMIAANLLLILPTAEDAFWVLTSMIENILPEDYYSPSLLTSRADQVVLRRYVTEILPQLSRHLDSLGIELEALTFQWFLSVFTDCLSAEALFRVWDVVLCLPDSPSIPATKNDKSKTKDVGNGQTHPHGAATFLFQVALALLKLNEKELLACDSPSEVYRYINRGMTDHAISIDNLIRASDGLRRDVKMEDVLERREEAVEAELEIMRKRETIRKGKIRAVDAVPPPVQPATLITNGDVSGQQTPKSKKKLSRQPSRAELDEEREALEYSELQVRTPMPIDEEVEWRA